MQMAFVKCRHDSLDLSAIGAYEIHRVQTWVSRRFWPQNHIEKAGRTPRSVADDDLDDS